MAGTVGTAYFKMKVSTEGITKDIEGAISGAGPGLMGGKAVGGAFKSAFTGAIAGVAASLTNSLVNVAKQGLNNITSSVDALAGYDYSMKFIKVDEKVVAKNKALLKEYSLSTMYSMNDVLDTSKVLASTGVKNFGNLTKALGNVVAMANGTGVEFKSMSNVMGKIQTAGKVTGETWSQITNTIPEMSAELKKELKNAGVYTGDFTKALSKGEIKAKDFNKAVMAVDKNSNGLGEAFAKGSSFFSGSLTAISNAVERLGIELVEKIGMTNITQFFNMVSDGISQAGDVIVSAVMFIKDNWNWVKPVTIGLIGLAAAIKGLLIIKSVVGAVKGAATAFKGLSVVTKIPSGGGMGIAGFMKGIAAGLKAMAVPQILLGAAILTATMVILAGGAWASIKIISNALPDLGKALQSFNGINGSNLVVIGAGLAALGIGLAAITSGAIINGLASFVGADFGSALRDIVEPIAELMPELKPEMIKNFAILGRGLMELGKGFEKVKGFTNGEAIATSITAINGAITAAVNGAGVDAYTQFGEKMKALATGLKDSISILAKSLGDIATNLKMFNEVNGSNLAVVGGGLIALAAGLVAITGSNVINGIANFFGADFAGALKGIIDPITNLMPQLKPEMISNFSLLGKGLAELGSGYEKIKGFSNGNQLATSITALNTAIQSIFTSGSGIEAYSSLSNKLIALSKGLTQLAAVNINVSNISSQLTTITNKIASLGNFNWSSTISKMKTKGSEVGKSVCDGITAGVNNNAFSFISAIGRQIDKMIANAKSKANSASVGKGGGGGGASSGKTISPRSFIMPAIAPQQLSSLSFDQPQTFNTPSISPLKASANTDYTPNSISRVKSSLSSLSINDKAPQIIFPKELKITDDEGIIMRVKPVIDEKIRRNNVDYKLI